LEEEVNDGEVEGEIELVELLDSLFCELSINCETKGEIYLFLKMFTVVVL